MDLFDGRYQKIALIGRGAFAEVWQAIDTQTNVTLALKIFTASSGMDEDGISMLTREFALMIDADHRNLLRPLYFGISQDDNRLPYLTLPYCKNGNINKMMGKMSEREAWKLIRDTASALAYLHAMNPPIIHQDIKPANILIGNDGYYKLSDFGVSIQARSTLGSLAEADKSFSSAGTISYMAPEKFSRDNRPIMANDIWSLGAMAYEMIAGDLPFGNDGGLIQKKGADIPELHGEFSHRLKQTLEDCLQEEPWKRPLASQLEETAIDALSKSPTVKITEEPDAKEESKVSKTLHDTEQDEQTTNSGRSKTRIIFASIATLVIIAGCILYYLSRPTESSPESTSMPVQPVQANKEEPVKRDTIPPESTDSAPTPPKADTPKPKTENPPKPNIEKAATAAGKLDLGYAVWEGKSINGKPYGYGTMTFREAHRIDSRDTEGNIAQNGDKVKGNYINGHLEYGTWIKNNGERIDIFIGQ